MKPYPKYKDSGIQWIGQIPEGWKVQAMKHLFYLKGRIGWQGLKAEEFIDEGPYLVTGTDFENGKVIWERCYHISKDRFNEAPEIHVKEGDLLITKDGTIGKLAYIDVLPGETSLNSHLLIIRPLSPDIINKYSYWLLQSEMFRRYTRLTQSGSIMDSLSQEKIANFKFPLPPISEQELIVRYLDDKTAKIDETVNLLEQQKADLQQYRKALISQTVTRGLNPNAKLKDSGISWIGQIPETWEIVKIGRLFSIKAGGDAKNEYYSENKDEKHPFPVYTNSLDKNSVYAYTSHPICDGDAITVTGRGAIGNAFYRVEPFDAIIRLLVLKKIKNETDSRYYTYFIDTVIPFYSSSAAVAQLSAEQMAPYKVCVPPISEQQAIADYLDNKTAKIDETIKRIDEQIADLRAYRTALISDVVTGKIDVRN